jgi:hypothetical protein
LEHHDLCQLGSLYRHPCLRDHQLAALEEPGGAICGNGLRAVRSLAPDNPARPKHRLEYRADRCADPGVPAGNIRHVPGGLQQEVEFPFHPIYPSNLQGLILAACF